MKLTTKILTATTVCAAGYAALFFYQPNMPAPAPAPAPATAPAPAPAPAPSPVEEARDQLAEATAKLNAEEARILSEIDAATTTAAKDIEVLEEQIAYIESKRDEEVARLNEEIEVVNSVRMSF